MMLWCRRQSVRLPRHADWTGLFKIVSSIQNGEEIGWPAVIGGHRTHEDRIGPIAEARQRFHISRVRRNGAHRAGIHRPCVAAGKSDFMALLGKKPSSFATYRACTNDNLSTHFQFIQFSTFRTILPRI